MIDLRKKNVIVIYSDRFPNGGAGANRQLTIAKGLAELGNIVGVHLVRPTEDRNCVHQNPTKGRIEGVNFQYTSGTNIWSPRNQISKLFLMNLGILRSILLIFVTNKKSQVDIIISGFSNLTANFAYSLLCKFLGIRFIYHVDEYPWMLINPKKYSRIYSFTFLRLFYKLFDSIIVINQTLFEYYSKRKKGKASIFILPMTVDSGRFKNIQQVKNKTFDFVYAGSMSIYKDGVDILISAYANFKKRIDTNTRLILIGSTKDQKTMEKLKLDVSKNALDDEVVFLGEKHRDEIPALLCNADALVLARPHSIQAEGGFPTKLGEYLLTGKPVLITNVGEIKNYLQDRISAYISEPEANSISAKMLEIYTHQEHALRVGQVGYQVAMEHFDYKNQIAKLNTYLNEILYGGISNSQ